MKIHIITIGKPRLGYARSGWDEYLRRLEHYHTMRVTQLADKFTDDQAKILAAAGNSYKIALAIDVQQFASEDLAKFLQKSELGGREVSFIIGGPEGLPKEVIAKADLRWSLSKLTLPHDLAMVVTLEALYRASTINAGLPYHR